MTALEQIQTYLRRVELRLRLFAATRGAAVIALLALALTLALVWIGNRYQFAQGVVAPLRILLFVVLATAVAFALAGPLLRLNRWRVTRFAERRIPGFQERLLTIAERADPANPFIDVLAEDALRIAREHELDEVSRRRDLLAFLGSGAVAAAVLLWLIAAGPGYWGYGASLLWTGSASPGKRPLYAVTVQPGNKTVRRKSDQLISAQLFGFSAHKITLHARYGGASKWEEIPMQQRPGGAGYQFLFAGLSDPVEYYVQADAAQSEHYKLAVKDLPGVKRVRVALHYPSNLGLKDEVQDPGGDIRAVQGTQAEISVLTDRPLEHGVLQMENGAKVELGRGDQNWLTARLPITKDGAYHVAALDDGEAVRISDDYFIEAKKDEAPSVRIQRPGRDPKVSPIEEVPVTVEASDDFGIEGMDLHYSVNGGPEQVVPLLKQKSVKEAQGSHTLYLENFKLVPGDLVSMYATARDANTTSRSDIVFAQAEPFDFKFTQSQQAGGGGGMGNESSDISERQKQIIAATWNQMKSGDVKRAAIEENARFLSDTQGKLSAQAKTLAERMGNRELSGANSQFAKFSELMTQASGQMDDAVSQLKPGKWHDALPPEQRALQSLLRAESLFRDIQVAFGQSGGGGMGSGAQRDLARMFDLELDTSKNQYETGQNGSQQQSDQQKAIDEAFQRLQELARRQQELASQNAQQQAMEQRWQEEQLRREAEELRRQMEQLAQGSQGQQSSQQQNGQSGSSSASGQAGQSARQNKQMARQNSGQERGVSDAMQQAASALQRAEEEMRKAVSEHDASAQRRASDKLAEAQNLLDRALHQQAGSSVGDLTQSAQAIASAQRDIANRMKQMYGQQSSNSRMGSNYPNSAEGIDGEMPEMNDPNRQRYYGYGYRRRPMLPTEPGRMPTEQERALAGEKDRLAQQLDQLQRQMQQQAENLAGTQPGAASKMRKALSEAEQKELALRMQKNAEWMRQGYGDRNLDMEDNITAGVEQLSRDLRDVQQALNYNGRGLPGNDSKEAQALAQVQALREMLQRAQQNNQGRQTDSLSRQPGGEQNGNGQQNGNGSPQNGQASGQVRDGQWNQFGGGPIDRPSLRDAIGQLSALRGQIDPRDRALRGYLDDSLGYLRTLNADPNVLRSTISQDAVVRLERLEVELSRRLGQEAQGARSSAAEASPEKYRDAVAEYFKKLSQPK